MKDLFLIEYNFRAVRCRRIAKAWEGEVSNELTNEAQYHEDLAAVRLCQLSYA